MATHPCVFIGLGGAGCTTVAHVKRLLMRALGADDLRRYCRFLMFDTNEAEYSAIQGTFFQEFRVDPHFIERNVEWFPIGSFNPYEYASEMLRSATEEARDIQTWLDPQSARTFPNKLADDGAGGERQRGRLCFALNFGKFDREIREATQRLNNLTNADGTKEPVHYWVITGSCGGTGSSAFYDLLYLIGMVHSTVAQSDPILRPVIFSPNPYIDLARNRNEEELERRYSANGYAFFLELQRALTRYQAGAATSAAEAAADSALPSKVSATFRRHNWRPFESALIVDTACEDAVSFIPFSQLYSVTAEMIAYNILTGADKRLNGWWMNAAPVQDPDTGTWQCWNAAGFRAVEYPSRPLRDYCSGAYYSELLGFYSAGAKKTVETVQRDRAHEILEGLILEPLGPSPVDRRKAGPASPGSFRSVTEGQYLNARARRWGSVDEFCKVDADKPDAAASIDPASLTADALRSTMDRLSDDIKLMKSDIRKDFTGRFGSPLVRGQGEYYLKLEQQIWAQLEDYLEQEGICTIIGPPDDIDSGVIPRLISLVTNRRTALQTALATSNARVDEIRTSASGLDKLRAEVAEEAEKLGGIRGVFVSGKGLRRKLELFAQKRRDLVVEAFNNQLLMLEIELLTFVGSPDTPVRCAEWFTNQSENVTSLLLRTKDQAFRIREWLARAASEADTRMKKGESDLQLLHSGVITHFMPGIETIALNGVRGSLAKEAMTQLQALDKSVGRRLQTFTALAGGESVCWAQICPREGDDSPGPRALFWTGAAEWVKRQFETDPTLTIRGSLSLAQHIGGDGDKRRHIREKLSADSVLAFSQVNRSVREKAPKYRLVVTETAQADDFTQAVSVGSVDTHLQDQSAPWRAVVVKYYTKLCLEKAFPMLRRLEAAYQQYTDYEPHIWKEGRSRIDPRPRSAREWAFSTGIAWAWMLSQGKWSTDPALRALFTKKLDYQPNGFLAGGPIRLDSRQYYLLDVELTDSMINSAGELECALQGVGYTKCGSVTDAWRSVQKGQLCLANLGFFQRALGGVSYACQEGKSAPTAEVSQRERAELFLANVAKFKKVLGAKVGAMEEQNRQARLQPADAEDWQTFGMVMNSLLAIEKAIEDELEGDGGQVL